MGRLNDWFTVFADAWHGRAKDPLPQPYMRQEAYPSVSGVTVTEDLALTLPAVHGAVRNVAEDVASLPISMFKRSQTGRDMAFWHPLHSLLHDKPNPTMTPVDMWGSVLYGAMLWGAGFVYVERATTAGKRWDGYDAKPGDPLALWPIQRPQRMVSWLDKGQLYYFYVQYDGETIAFAPDEIMPVRGFSKDGIYGLGLLKFGSEAIGAGLSTQTFAAAFFGNGTQVGGTLSIPAGLELSEKAKENLRKSLYDGRGSDRAFRARLLEDGITWSPGGVPPKDAQMLEQRLYTVDEVCRLTRETPDALGDLTHATYTNIEFQAINRVTRTLRPWYTRIDQSINCFLLSNDQRGTYYAEHDPSPLLQADIKTRYEAYGQALRDGWMNRDAVRAKENLNTMPNEQGQFYIIQSNQTTVERIGAGETTAIVRETFSPLAPEPTPDPSPDDSLAGA